MSLYISVQYRLSTQLSPQTRISCCQCGILQVLEINVLCSLLILLQLYLGFHAFRVKRDKKHIMLEICIFFIFDFSERLIVLLFA